MAKGLKLDSTTHDLVYTDGELEIVTNEEEITRNVKTRLLSNKGEFKLDRSYGFPYQEVLGTHYYNLSELETIIKQFILDTQGITELTRFNLDFEKGNERKLKIDFTALTIYGRIIVNDALDNSSGGIQEWSV